MSLRLVKASINDPISVLEMLHEIEPNSSFLNNEYNLNQNEFPDFLNKLIDYSNAKNLKDGWVPYTTFWLFSDDRPVGVTRLRHFLNDSLKVEGGHIGSSIRPSERGKGYGDAILKLTIEKAKEIGLTELLITVKIDNVFSNKVAKKYGTLIKTDNEINYYQILLPKQ